MKPPISDPYEIQPQQSGDLAIQGKKRKALLALLVLYYVWGYCDYWLQNQDHSAAALFNFAILIVQGIFVLYWFLLNAKERNFKLSKLWCFMLFGFGLLAVPFYFVKTRGRKAMAQIGLALLVAIVFGAAYGLG